MTALNLFLRATEQRGCAIAEKKIGKIEHKFRLQCVFVRACGHQR